GPSLKYMGNNFVPGQFNANWIPISAEKTTTGYVVAWKVAGVAQRTILETQENREHFFYTTSYGTGVAARLKSIWITFHQDLNGDGVIGTNTAVTAPVTTVIESNGSTSLTKVGSTFYLYDSSGSGPSLKFGGKDFVMGQFNADWTPISAEKTATGYIVAW